MVDLQSEVFTGAGGHLMDYFGHAKCYPRRYRNHGSGMAHIQTGNRIFRTNS